MAVLFTSDLHLGHKNVIEFCNRNKATCGVDFKNVEEMDDFLIDRWNRKVQKDDTVYIIGDLSFRSGKDVARYLKRMNGKKHVIAGNHDYKWQKHMEDVEEYLESVSNMEVIRLEKKLLTLNHYPMLEWNGSHRAQNQEDSLSWLIHGHIHDERESKTFEYIKKYQPCALNAGVDINHFEPVTFEEMVVNNNQWYERDKITKNVTK